MFSSKMEGSKGSRKWIYVVPSVIVVVVVLLVICFSWKRRPTEQEWRSATIREARHIAVILSTRGAYDYNAEVVQSPFIGTVDARVAFKKLWAERASGPVKLDASSRWVEQQCFVDPWGTPYSITAVVIEEHPQRIEVQVTSAGPNKRFEFGAGDDISEKGESVVFVPERKQSYN